jgi:hypothetical protein
MTRSSHIIHFACTFFHLMLHVIIFLVLVVGLPCMRLYGIVGLDKGDIDEITEVLRARLEGSGEMYTSIGDNVLVALNPYSSLAKSGCPLYDDKVALHYWRRSPHLTAPHVYKHVRVHNNQ